MRLHKPLFSFDLYSKIISEIKKLWEVKGHSSQYCFVFQPRLIQTVKQKYVYIIFEKEVC